MEATKPRFIVVDDDPINNMICKKVITKTIPDAEVITFTEPEKVLDYLLTTYEKPASGKAILFLDTKMSSMTGWEFLDRFKTFAEPIKNQYNIYILSSSVDPTDIQRAKLNPLVIDFIEKPLNKTILTKIFG